MDQPHERPEGMYKNDVPPAEPQALTGVLTAREIEIAQLVGAAKRNKEIARNLCLTQQTVENHLRNIYAKLNIHSRVELALLVRDVVPPGHPPEAS
jgi:DNA-binding CsgD family transcriptional regulator